MTAEKAGETLAGETVGALLKDASDRLREAAVAAPRRDARLLLAHALDVPVERILGYPETPVDGAERLRVAALVARRVEREPVSRILGSREFWGLTFAVTPETLDPRPDSECLVEAVLRELPDRAAKLRILDLGTGTGCLLLALLSELPEAFGIGLDLSHAAAAVAKRNAADLGLDRRSAFLCGDWCESLSPRCGAQWDVIVGNPPYVATAFGPGLEPEVARFDPDLALYAGADGLAAYERLGPMIALHLAEGGICALEVGLGQANSVESLLRNSGLSVVARARDLTGLDRCIVARRNRQQCGNQGKKSVGKGRIPDYVQTKP